MVITESFLTIALILLGCHVIMVKLGEKDMRIGRKIMKLIAFQSFAGVLCNKVVLHLLLS